MKTLRHYGGSYQSRAESWADVFRNREPFKAANMRGVQAVSALPCMLPDGRQAGTGVLPEPVRTEFCRSFMDFIVYSYETPIAWHSVDTGWHVPNISYSLTTSNHQRAAIMALHWAGIEKYHRGEHINTRKGKGRTPFGSRDW